MKTLSYFAASAAQVARHAVSVLKIEWQGASGLASDRFLQVHDAYAAPAEEAVPLRVWPIYTGAAGYKLFDVGELQLANGCYICISETEATKTLASGADDFSTLSVELAEAETPAGTTLAGDLTTDVFGLDVWADNAGPKRLYEIIATNNYGQAMHLQVHASTTPSTDTIVWASESVADGATIRVGFGKDGREINRIIAGALKQGCRVVWDEDHDLFGDLGDVAGTIQAEYK